MKTRRPGATIRQIRPKQAFDGDLTTKWLDFSPQGSWIQYDCQIPTLVTGYAITSGADGPERDPASWQLLGSNDGKTWTTLDTRTWERWSARQQTRDFTCTSPATYRFYRLKITAVRDAGAANSVQISEIKFTTQ